MKTLKFDKEESFLRGHIPLQKFKKQIETIKWESLETIDFSGNGYCTDAVINIIRSTKKGTLSALERVDLRGCQILTDVGIKWLSEVLESANKLKQVNLDGCCLVSDVGLAHLLEVLPEKCHVSVIGTAVCRLTSARNKHVRAGAGSTFPPDEETTDFKQGGVLVVPHSSIKSSIAHTLNGKMDVPLTGLHHVTTDFKDGWKMNINEVTVQHPLFDVLVHSKPIKVVIPFDSSADLNDVTKHVTDVVSKVIMKEPEHPFMEVGKFHSPFDGKVRSGDQFMDVRFVLDHKLDLENSVLENWPVIEAEKEVDGCFLSRTFFTKSHPYFEVQFIKKENTVFTFSEVERPDELLIGCVRDYYYAKMFAKPGNYYNRISGTEAKNVMVHRFSLKNVKKGDTFGFGIRGEWESEYNAGSSCRLFVTHNGTEVKYEGNPEDLMFNRFYYPCLAINSHCTCQFKLPHLLSPPVDLMNAYKKEQRWIRHCYTDFCVINNNGIISMNKHANKTSDAIFLSEQPVGTKDTSNTSFTVKIVEDPGDFKIKVGLVVQGYLQNSYTCYLVLHGHNGEMRCKTEGDSVNLVPSPTKLAIGDEIKFQWEIERQPISFHETKEFPVKIFRNGKLLCQTDYTFSFKGGLPEEMVYVFLNSHSTNERRVQLLNYQPHFRPPVTELNKIIPAIQRGLQIYDDGVLLNKHDGKSPYMVSRTPINPQLTYFEMEIVASGTDGEIGLGLTHNMPDNSETIGKSRYEIMFYTINTAGNGKVFHMDAQKSLDSLKLETGDVVGCGLEGKFGDDGRLVENSEVEVFFTINCKEIHRQKLPYRSDHLFPFFLQTSNSAVLRVRGFTADTDWNKIEFQPKDQKNLPSAVSRFSGCEFSVVDVSGGGNASALKNKMSLDKLPCIQTLKESMKRLEGDVGSFAHQQRLSELHRALENIDRLSKSPERVKFLSLKLSTKEGVEAMKKTILNQFLSHSDLQMPIYSLPQTLLKVVESTRKELKSRGICQVVDGTSEDHSCPTLYERIKNVSPTYLTGEMFLQLVERMFHQGHLICVQTDCGLLAVDLEFAAKSVESLINFSKVENLKTGITAFGEKSIVWKADMKDEEREKLILIFLQNYLGLMKVPVTLRTSIKDEKLVFALLRNLDPPKFTFREFIAREKAVKDCILIQSTYSFPAFYPHQLFPLVLAATVGYGRPIILSQEGGVFLFGAVQVIVREETTNGTKMLMVECRCFLPQKRTQSVNEDTEKSVREYTKHIFFIVTDLVDRIIKRQGIVAVISQNIPPNSVNASLGCNHNWSPLPDTDHIQSVCTLCNLCCESGEQCPYNRIMGTDHRECGCKTTTPGCVDCGICVTCAKGLWDLRTELRPMAMSITSNADIYRATLNPVTFNEIEVDVISGMCPPMCLSSERSTIMAAPGLSRSFSSDGKISLSDVRQAQEYNKDLRLCIREGDRLKIRLSAPKGYISSTADKSNTAGVTPAFVQYYTDICKEALVLQEAGVVCYKTGSKPVAQFVAPKPFSEALKRFSIKILCGGSKNCIGVGMCPRMYASNNMPGWKSKSFGYHADDGGIFIEKGSSQTKVEKCSDGDVMAVEFDVKSSELKFFKNDQEVHVHKMTVPGNGKLPDFYPMIGLHSEFECVKLLEIEPWTPLDPNARKEIPKSIDFTEVEGLIISPPKTIILSRLFYALCSGQIILHNTTKTPLGYKFEPARIFKARDADGGEDCSTGIIEANDTKVIMCHAEQQISKLSDITIEWIELQKNKTYPDEDLKKSLKGKCHVYRLSAIMKHTDYNRGLSRVVKGEKRKDYVLEIFKNAEMIEQYWITPDNYCLTLPFDYGQYAIRYPKCPSLNFPEQLEKGMKVFIALPNNSVAEAVIIGVEHSGKYQLEYSPEGDRDNEVITGDHSIMEVKGYKEGDPVLMYRNDASQKSLSQSFVYAPPYLVPEECANVLKLTDSNWISTLLNQAATCLTDINRLTVQEQMMVMQSRNLIGWLDGYGANGSVEDTFAFLPKTLNTNVFLYPSLGMFVDLNVHRLCFYADQLLNYQQQKKIHLRNPLHFMDMHALTPKSNVPLDVTFACKFQGWVYIALIAKQLLLPSHQSILPEKDLETFSRTEIEHLMFGVVHQFATLSSLFAAQYGGLQNQSNPVSGTKSILQIIEGQCQPLIKYKGNPITEQNNLIQEGVLCICKAHKLSMATSDYDLESELDITYDFFQPYMENVNSIDLSHTKKVNFPGDFFEKLPNLENFSLTGCFLKDKHPLPGNSGTLKELRYVNIGNVNVTELPSDILRAEKLKEARFQGIPLVKIKNIMQRFSKPYVLTKLILNDIKLEELPSDIKNLTLLEELSIDHNPLKRLPIALKELKKLRVLSIKGFPLMNFNGEVESLTRQQYKAWHKENPAIINFLTTEKVDALFDEVDRKRRGSLDVSEIAQLNLKLFFLLPRFGTDGFNEKYGGWPDVIFKLTQLKELYFGYQGITLIPSDLKALTHLEVVDLQHCPLLETLSAKLGFMTNLKNINLQHCPSLRTPPHEVVSRGFESVKAYLKRLDGGFTTCRRTKLMFVGVGDAGKTSLLKALTSTSKKTSGTQNAMLTDGIDIKSWKVKVPDKGEIVYSAWDFAGQSVYYNTHQFFLTSRAVYLLLWNMRMGFQHAGLDFWLSSIACHAPDAPVLIIGTQADQIPKPEIEEKVIKNSYPQIQGFHYVSSIQGTGIKELEEQLIEITLQQPYLEEKIPQVWLNLEDKMLKMRKDSSILDWSQVEQIARDEGIYHEQDLKEAISFLDNLGTVQYFDTDFLRDKVVVDPQWIVKVMACVVSVRASAIQKNDGRFEHSQLDVVWDKYDAKLRPWLLSLTEEFDLTFPLPGQPLNIVPCLLPIEPPEEFRWPDLDPLSSDGISENKIMYKFVYLPGGLFNRLQVRLFNFSDGKMIWKKGSYLQKNQHLALIQQNSERQLTVTVQGPRPENVLFLIHEVLESLITESYHGVTYDYYIPCPDCIAKGSDSFRNPYLFKASIIKKGKNMNAPFLQCTENFHTVAMTQLLAIMPDDRNSDFDIHLQNSISALQSINNDIEYDVAVLYCQANVPPKGKNDLINPKEVKNDLRAWNYSVWMPESVTPDRVSEMTLQLKNSKVVVCCMSDQFEKDETCHNLFLYITNQLRKKVLIVVVRPSMAWQETDLGMKIGDAFVCMIRTPDRYKSKIVDLKDMVEKTLIAMEKDKQRPADVFISYCWQNSKKAVDKGTKIKDKSSLGAVDPRDIKDYLTDKKVACWIDIEKIGTYGLYMDIAMGLQGCKLLVCCVSDEYSDSENCMMELKYAVLNLKLPVIVVPVGTGSRWKSKVGIFVVKTEEEAPEISMQLEDNKEKLLTKVKEILATKCKTEDEAKEKQKQEKERKKNLEKKAQDLKFSYQEEYELLQRKFLRHVTMITTKLNFEVLPRLLVFDFVKAGSTGKSTEQGTPRRPRTGKERRKAVILDDEDEDWQAEEFCVKVMCEHEEGWHVSEKSLNLSARSTEEVYHVIREAAPYLSRLYAVLKQSSVNLNCLRGKTGDSFCSYIDKKGLVESNFGKAYEAIHHFVADHAGKRDLMQKLHRCHLPSGKILWLCDNHSKGNRITKLSLGGGSSRSTGLVTLTREDDFLKEHMRKHPTVIKLLKRPEPVEEEENEEGNGEEKDDNTEERDADQEQMEDNKRSEDNNTETAVHKTETPPEVFSDKSKGNLIKNTAIKQGGPINRVGSPCPSRGAVEINDTPKNKRREQEKGKGSPTTSRGDVQSNDAPKKQDKAETNKESDEMPRSTKKSMRKDPNSTVCVLS